MTPKHIKMHVVSHTHWDREWYFTLEEYRFRLVRMMDLLIDCMEQGKLEYFTMDGQTRVLKDYLERRPEKRERLEKLIRAGRIFIGPWYTQPNVFMSCQEAQIRNLEFGARDVAHYGNGLKHNYMPDQFGYTGQLPQIMKGFDLDTLIGSRGMDKGCDTLFIWEGNDGTQVPAAAMIHCYGNIRGVSTRRENATFDVFGCTLSMSAQQNLVSRVLSEEPRSPAPHLLALDGVDHKFPNPTMVETLESINQNYPQVNAVQSNFDLYLQDMMSSLTRPLKIYRGELRDPRENVILPASQSTRMDVKLTNIACEDALIRVAEPEMAIMTVLGQKNLPEADLNAAWEMMLQNHAHDSLCCSNVDPSYEEIMARYSKIQDITRESVHDMDQHFIRLIQELPQQALIVKNPSAFDRNEPVTMEVIVPAHRKFQEPHLYVDGSEIPCRINAVRQDSLLRYIPFLGHPGTLDVSIFTVTAEVGNIPALGYRTVEIQGGKKHASPAEGLITSASTMENEYLKVTVAPDASVSVLDKTSGNTYTGLNVFRDDGEAGNGFEHIEPCQDQVITSCGTDLQLSCLENDPQKGIIRISQNLIVPESLSADRTRRSNHMVKIQIITNVILRRGVKSLEFETEIDNRAKDHRLRVCFPTDCRTEMAFCGQPFDVQHRPVQPKNVNELSEGDCEAYVGYHPMHDFCGIADGTRGAVIAGGLTEYEVLPMRKTLTVTLLRALERLYAGVLADGSKFKLKKAQLQKKISCCYSFIPCTDENCDVLRQVEAARHPVVAVQKDFLEEESMPTYQEPVPMMPASAGFLRLEGNAVLTALRPSPSDPSCITVRFFNPTEEESGITLHVDSNYCLKQVKALRLDEQKTDPAVTDLVHNGRMITLTAGKKKIITLKMRIEHA